VSVAQPPKPTQGANIYVSGLDPHTTDDTLRAVFSPYGTVVETKTLIGIKSIHNICIYIFTHCYYFSLDYNSGQCRGVGFVRYGTREEAQNAIRSLNNQTVPQISKPLHVKVNMSIEYKNKLNFINFQLNSLLIIMMIKNVN
jgi:RNA recognition motif-containing protein